MRHARFARVLTLAALPVLAACQQDVRQAPVVSPLQIASRDQGRPFFLEKLEFNLRRGQDIGGYQGVLFTCVSNPTRITWDRGRLVSDGDWSDRFYDTFAELGYPVVGNPANPLERDRERSRAEYTVFAQVTGIELAVCDRIHPLLGYRMGTSGKAWMAVTWQVYNRAQRRVVHEAKTEGSADVSEPSHSGTIPLLLAAFDEASKNLGGDAKFHAVVSGAAPADTGRVAALPEGTASIRVAGLPPEPGSIQDKMSFVRAAVPTIDLGSSHGSAVFISADGYLLTNDHVVKARREVTVRLPGGAEILAEVVRTNPVRDIALVKVPLARAPAVPVRRGGVSVGEEVYAVGTPLEARLAQSVTRGIVSAVRIEQMPGSAGGLPMIQSDVTIQGGNSGGGLFDRTGNLVGIAVSGIGQMNSGTNFFIPIDDALEKLGIDLTQQPRPAVR